MKRIFLFSLLFFLPIVPVAFSAEIPLESRIREVTVFQDRAMVARVAQTKLVKGDHALVLSNLPLALDESSVQVKAEGNKLTLYGTKVETEYRAQVEEGKLKQKLDERQNLLDQKRALEDKRKIEENNVEMLNSIRAASSQELSKELVAKEPSLGWFTSVYEYSRSEVAKVFGEVQKLDAQLRELNKKIEALDREIAEQQKARMPDTKKVVVELSAQADGGASIELSYIVWGASWLPLYEVRADLDQNQVEMFYFGVVRQNSGEDWSNVSLILSTAKPSLGATRPEPEPWYLRRREPVVMQEYRQAAKASAMPAMAMLDVTAAGGGFEEPAPSAPEKAELGVARVEAQQANVTFRIAKLQTVASDNQPHRVPIARDVLAAQLSYSTVPSLVPFVYVKAKVKNDSQAVYLAGEALVFRGQTFIGQATLKETQPQEEFEDLFVGIDEGIKVKRELLKDQRADTFFQSFVEKTRRFQITLENFKTQPVTVEVLDVVPTPQDKSIEVKLLDPLPKPLEPTAEEKAKGVLRWQVTVPPQTKQTIAWGFKVKCPSDFPMEGI